MRAIRVTACLRREIIIPAAPIRSRQMRRTRIIQRPIIRDNGRRKGALRNRPTPLLIPAPLLSRNISIQRLNPRSLNTGTGHLTIRGTAKTVTLTCPDTGQDMVRDMAVAITVNPHLVAQGNIRQRA